MNSISLVAKIDDVIRLFLYILIFWLPYSSAVIESCVISCLILWLVKRFILINEQVRLVPTVRKKLRIALKTLKPQLTFLNIPIVFFLVVCLLSVAGSAFWEQSLHNFFTKTLEWFIIYFLVVEVFKDKKHVYIALVIFMFTAFSTVIDSLVQFYITNKDIFNGHMIESESRRATAGFKTSNGLGGYLTVFIPGLTAWVFLGKQKLQYRLGTLLILILSAWSLVVTFSRGAWIGTFFGITFFILYVFLPKKRLSLYFCMGTILGIVGLCITFFLMLSYSFDQELIERYQTVYWRLSVWGISMDMIKDKIFFGHGINTFMKVFQAYRGNLHMDPTYAHNCYFQLAAETGLVGLACFFWIVMRAYHCTLDQLKIQYEQNRNLSAIAVGLLSGIFAFLVHSFFDTHFYTLQLSAYMWFLFGMLVAIFKISEGASISRSMNQGY